jgi:hypothetical protein
LAIVCRMPARPSKIYSRKVKHSAGTFLYLNLHECVLPQPQRDSCHRR